MNFNFSLLDVAVDTNQHNYTVAVATIVVRGQDKSLISVGYKALTGYTLSLCGFTILK